VLQYIFRSLCSRLTSVQIDHFPRSPRYEPHAKGTFKQRYCFDDSYYEPGGPVFLYISGETSVESRFDNLATGIIQILTQQFNGLGIILENRYYGHSYPFNTSTTDQLAYLTTEQTIADNHYFATHVKLPGIGNITAPATPWILYGGSLAGAQTAFSLKTYGDTLYGGIASSGVIHAVLGYLQW
jgi:Serine carboxypeptidase S28